jgi:predicted glutamine amidotransferase
VRATLARLTRLGEELGGRALLTLLVADGTHLVAVRGAHQATPPTLYMADEPGRGAVSFASEPLDAQRTWQPLGVGQIWLAKVGQPPVESEPS